MATKKDWSTIGELIKTQTLQQIGDRYSISRERVRQILRKQGIDTPKREFSFQCWLCPNEFTMHFPPDAAKYRSEYKELCNSCRQYLDSKGKRGVRRRNFEIGPCYKCGKRRGNRAGLCPPCNTTAWRKNHPEWKAKIKERMKSDPEYREKRLAYYRKYYHEHKKST